MSRRIKKHAKVLHFLANCDKRHSNAIINEAEPDLINCFSEICHNILQGNVRLSGHQKSKLKKYKTHLRRVAGRNATAKTKKKIIQTGGFLPMLLGSLVKPLLQPLLSGLVS